MTGRREPIMQAADGEVKPDPPIEIYRSEIHGYWMARWRLHDYALGEWPLTADGATVAAWIEQETGAKVEVVDRCQSTLKI